MTDPISTPVSSRWRARRWFISRRHRVVVALATLLVICGLVLGIANPFGVASSGSSVIDNEYPTSTQSVTRETLSSQTQVTAILGYAGSYTISIPTGTTPSTVIAARSTAESAETEVPDAEDIVSTDETALAQAGAQLSSDEGLACPASSSSTVTTPVNGTSPGNSTSSASTSSSPGGSSGNGSSPGSNSGSGTKGQAPADAASDDPTTTPTGLPEVMTGVADHTTNRATTLTGTVDANGAQTSFDFEYGTSPNYGETTGAVGIGSGTSAITITSHLNGLTPGATYYYRLVATNGDGTNYGDGATFETNAAPTVSTGTATSISATRESLGGTIDPNGVDTGYFFEWGTTASLGHRTAQTDAGGGQVVSSVIATITGLTPGATYDYALVATSSLGTEVGETAVFQAAASSCTAERTVISEDSDALSEARSTLSADKATASADEQALAADEVDVANPNSTFSALPAIGARLKREMSVYSLNGKPVPLFYGNITIWRALYLGVSGGPDVTELEENLIALGFEHGEPTDRFTATTEAAVKSWQASLGEKATGTVAIGDVVVETGPIEVDTVSASTGGAATSGITVLTATSTTSVVTIDLDTSLQSDVKVGDPVTITLPNNENTPGVVSSVGTVATSAPSSSSNSSSSGPTITVIVTPTSPSATGDYDEAPVNVSITNGTAPNVLAVPVDALLALVSGGYALEEVGSNGSHHLVPVSVGLFDDQAGLVQVSGSGLAAGQSVVVPQI